jgi:hypothetical protein
VTSELKFLAASAAGRTRCGEFVDQKDKRKPVVLLISDQKLGLKKGFAKVSYFFLRLPWLAVASCDDG